MLKSDHKTQLNYPKTVAHTAFCFVLVFISKLTAKIKTIYALLKGNQTYCILHDIIFIVSEFKSDRSLQEDGVGGIVRDCAMLVLLTGYWLNRCNHFENLSNYTPKWSVHFLHACYTSIKMFI